MTRADEANTPPFSGDVVGIDVGLHRPTHDSRQRCEFDDICAPAVDNHASEHGSRRRTKEPDDSVLCSGAS